MIDDVLQHWAGKGTLARAYWIYGGVGTVVLFVIAMIGVFMILPRALEESADILDILEYTLLRRYIIGVYVVLNVYQVFVGVLVWRNASNVGNPIWGHVAKVVVVLGALGLVYEIYRAV